MSEHLRRSPRPRAVLHVDMDAFYASVEQRDRPELSGQPVIVGGHPTRGVVLAASYEVRRFGVRSAMSMRQALRACPHAKVVAPRFPVYAQVSDQVHAIFHRFTPEVEPLSLDEAFLDVTGSVGLFGPPADQALAIRQAIADELHLPASAGIAPVKLVAKIASDLAKPNGQREVTPEGLLAFLHPLPVGRLWGVGPKTAEALRRMGLRTLGDLAAAEPSLLTAQLGSAGAHLHALAQGRDDRPVVPDRLAQQIGAEETFSEDLAGPDALAPHLLEQSVRVARRLRRAGLKARAVTLKVKYADFRLVSRSCHLERPSDDEQAIHRAARALLDRVPLDGAVRLTGVSAGELVEAGAGQLGLFDPPAERRREALLKSLDAIAERFGEDAVTLGTLVGRKGPSD